MPVQGTCRPSSLRRYLLNVDAHHCYYQGRRRKTRCVYPPGDPVCVLCKSRDGRCIEQGYEEVGISESKPSVARKQPANGKASQGRNGISADQPPKFTCSGDVETSDVLAAERANYAPIVSLLVDAKVSLKIDVMVCIYSHHGG